MSSTLLLADDSLTIQKVVELTFADTDFEVIAVSSGEELLRRIPECRPDIIVCDVIMPGKDGYQVCQDVKSDPDTLHIPVILLTGTFEPFDRDRALSAGCSEVITKPFEARKLVETVERLVHGGAEPAPSEPDADVPGGVTPPWPADEGGFQPLETYSGEDDLDFGTRLAPSGPEPEPEAAPEEDEGFGAPDELPPAAEEPPAPADEPQLEAEDFDEVDLGPADLDTEGAEVTAPEPDEDFAFGEPPPPAAGFDHPEEGPAAEEDEVAARDAAEASAAEGWAPDAERWHEAPAAADADAPAVTPSSGATATAPPTEPTGERARYAVVAGPGEADDPFASDEAAVPPELDTGPVAASEAPPTPAPSTTALSDEDVDRIARRVLELASGTVERIAWEVIPDMAELVVRERVRELEAEVESRRGDEPQ